MVQLEYYIEIANIVMRNPDLLDSLHDRVKELGNDETASRPTKYSKTTAQINSIQFILYPKETDYTTLGDRLVDYYNRGRIIERHIVLLVAWYYTQHYDEAKTWHTDNIQQKLGEKEGCNPVYAGLPAIKNKADFEALFSEVGEILDYKPSSQQPILIVPEAPTEEEHKTHYYSHRALKIIGRDEEQETLRKFAGNKYSSGFEAGFKWMQLAGEGGQGKSRLALELADDLKDTWNAGFIPTNELDTFQDKWRDWNPDCATLIIVDYIIADMKYLKNLIYYLSLRKDEFPFPVRLLLLERQRWDYSGLPLQRGQQSPQQVFATGLGDGIADWFANISGKKQEREIIKKAKAEPNVETLKALNPQELTQITKKWANKVWETFANSHPLELPPDKMIEESIGQIDETGRPLFAYFLGEAIAWGQDFSGWKIEDLLNATLERDIKHRWKYYFQGDPLAKGEAPSFECDHPALRLAVLATIIRSIDTRELKRNGYWPERDPQTRKQALAVTNGSIREGYQRKKISGLMPDILGEWFVISAIAEGVLQTKMIIDTAWRTNPTETVSFLVRLSRDFPHHQGSCNLLAVAPPNEGFINSVLDTSVATIMSNLWASSQKFPKHLVSRLKSAAHNGDAGSMRNFGVCSIYGIGVPQDDSEAFFWFEKAAKLKDARAMTNLAVCYARGRGAPKNDELALHWCQEAIALDEVSAMGILGVFLQKGRGITQDTKQAVRLYKRAAKGGDIPAAVNLGLCYKTGEGVEQDNIKSFHWFDKAAQNGSLMGMTCVGICYVLGEGTTQDQSKGIYWLELAHKAGSELATEMLSRLAM